MPAADSADPYQPGPLVRVRTAVAHRPLVVGVPLLTVAVAASFVGWPSPDSTVGPTADVVQGAAQVAFIGFQVLSLVHDRRLCLRCLADAPVAPEPAVDAARGRLRWFHRIYSLGGLVLGIAVSALLITAGALLHPVFGVLAMAPFLPLATVSLTHHRLEPWCPYCRWDDGDEDDDPEPDPEPHPPGRRAPLSRVGPLTRG